MCAMCLVCQVSVCSLTGFYCGSMWFLMCFEVSFLMCLMWGMGFPNRKKWKGLWGSPTEKQMRRRSKQFEGGSTPEKKKGMSGDRPQKIELEGGLGFPPGKKEGWYGGLPQKIK